MYNEEEILNLLKNEETQRKAFTMIVERYKEQLYWQIRRIVLSHDDANDILQDTFIKAWGSINLFRGDAKMATWLYRIAMNECITFLNKQKTQTEVSLDNPDASMVEKLDSDIYFNGDKALRLLQEALLTLPIKQRMVFNMKYYQEMKYEEMSDVLGTTVGALKASYFHAVKKIQKYIELNY